MNRRHAERIAQVWLQRIKESSPNKRLVLIYLANEITQTSKMRKKEEFLRAYEPIIAEATSVAYRGAPVETQNKIRRVVEVWRQRQIFALKTQTDIEKQIDELDRSKSTRKPALGGSLFSASSIPPELAPVVPLATTLQKADLATKPAVGTANQEYEKLTSPNATVLSPPMHAAGLAALCRKLAVAEGAVAESIKARQALISGLEKILETNKSKLEQDEAQASDLTNRKDAIDSRKREVEAAILKGLSAAETNKISAAPLPVVTTSPVSQDRPQIEELTPPPMESFTPVGSPQQAAAPGSEPVPDIGGDAMADSVSQPVSPQTAVAPDSHALQPENATAIGEQNQHVAEDLLKSLQQAPLEANGGTQGQQMAYQNTYKKRKMSRSTAEDEFAAFAGDGDMKAVDDDLSALI